MSNGNTGRFNSGSRGGHSGGRSTNGSQQRGNNSQGRGSVPSTNPPVRTGTNLFDDLLGNKDQSAEQNKKVAEQKKAHQRQQQKELLERSKLNNGATSFADTFNPELISQQAEEAEQAKAEQEKLELRRSLNPYDLTKDGFILTKSMMATPGDLTSMKLSVDDLTKSPYLVNSLNSKILESSKSIRSASILTDSLAITLI